MGGNHRLLCTVYDWRSIALPTSSWARAKRELVVFAGGLCSSRHFRRRGAWGTTKFTLFAGCSKGLPSSVQVPPRGVGNFYVTVNLRALFVLLVLRIYSFCLRINEESAA